VISRPSSILLVDRGADEREMYAEYLGGEGFSTRQAQNAVDAFRMATEAPPEVVVTEMRLDGGHTGIELVTRLRKDARTRDVPLIVLTGRVFDEDRARAVRAGCDMFLGKPCLPDELARQIRYLLARGRPEVSQISTGLGIAFSIFRAGTPA
jgi:two-component system phosphate regulon response regulator PhoB